MIHKYKLSGSGGGQRAEDDSNHGRVHIEQCVEGNDGANFIESGIKEIYLLYWLHKLDVEGFVQFTL